MSVSRQRARDLVNAYDHSLEQQIVGQGSSLASRDEELWKQVEMLLREGDAQEVHCLGLDPLRVMEESLKVATATTPVSAAACGRRVQARGGLQSLAKAFEVLEQAALNLYLGHWREEYKVIKMYSGAFTHYITPVLSVPQIESLFGLLGYRAGSPRPELLCLQSPRVSTSSLDDLLRLSCAFFMARCECCLLLTALGKHAGDAQWELSLVWERQRGHNLQVALDNTKKSLEVSQPVMDNVDVEVDLYQDEQVNGGQHQVPVSDDESPHSLTWAAQSCNLPLAVKAHGNGGTSSSSPLESDLTRSSSASRKEGRLPCGESRSDKTDSLCKSEPKTDHFCSCLHSPYLRLKRCVECSTLHHFTCASLDVCNMKGHHVEFTDCSSKEMESELLQNSNLACSSVAMSSLALCDEAESMSPPLHLHPIAFHDCCDPAQLDPQLLCRSCVVFHSGSCKEMDVCQVNHDVLQLGMCYCGKVCSRKPMVLCRYCGNEYCNNCWYRNPVTCHCGQTFDQSSSV